MFRFGKRIVSSIIAVIVTILLIVAGIYVWSQFGCVSKTEKAKAQLADAGYTITESSIQDYEEFFGKYDIYVADIDADVVFAENESANEKVMFIDFEKSADADYVYEIISENVDALKADLNVEEDRSLLLAKDSKRVYFGTKEAIQTA